MDELIELLISLMTNAFELYIISRVMGIFFNNNIVSKNALIITYSIRYVMAVVIMLEFSYPFINILTGLGTLFLITLSYKSPVSKKIAVTVMIYMCLFLAEAVIAACIGLSGFNVFEKAEFGNAFISIIIQIIFWLCSVVLGKFKNVKVNIPMPKSFIATIIIVPITSVFLEVLIFQQDNLNKRTAAISLVFVLASNFIMMYVFDSLSKLFAERTQAEIVRREKTYYHNQSELLQKNYEELRQFRHDVKNKLFVIKQMLAENETERIAEYISNIEGKLEGTKVYSQSGNIIVDSLINYKLGKAAETGVDVKANVGIPKELSIEDDDVVIILGNLLDNAIEATNKLDSAGYIEVSFEYNKNCVFITVKNNYNNIINIVNGAIRTSKEDDVLHGIGLKSVEAALDKYDGVINCEYNDNEFVANVILYV